MEDISRALHNFNAISVREKTGGKILENMFKVKSELVLDPTMLHSGYDEIVNKIDETNNIVCYLLNRTKEQLKASRYVSKQLGKNAQLLTSVYPIRGFKYVYPPSIEDWIRYIAGASLVITDSFHGVVFSLLYKRNFIVIAVNNGKNSRLLDLLKMVGLENRYFTSMKQLEISDIYRKSIDYMQIDVVIKKNKDISLAFLVKSLRTER